MKELFADTTPLDHPLYKMFSLSQGSDCAKTDADFCAFLLLLRLSRREYLKDCSLSSSEREMVERCSETEIVVVDMTTSMLLLLSEKAV